MKTAGRFVMRWWALWIAVAFVVGCSGGTDGGGTGPVAGSITGREFRAAGAAAATGRGTCEVPDYGTQHLVALFIHLDAHRDTAYLSNPANACGPLRPQSESLEVILWRYVPEGAEAAFAPGVYTIHQDHQGGVAGIVARLDERCHRALPNAMVDVGTVTLTSVDASTVHGELRFTFDDGSGVSGTFEAPIVANGVAACSVLGLPGGVAPPPACSPEPVCSAAR